MEKLKKEIREWDALSDEALEFLEITTMKTKTSKNLTDKERCKIVIEEIERFEKLIKGHRKLLEAIGKL